MLQLYEDKRPKEQGNLFFCYFQPKTGPIQESGEYITEIRNLKTKDIIFFFEYYVRTNEAKDIKKLDINPEVNYPITYRYKYQSITLNHHLLLDSSQIGPNQYKLYFLYNNHLFIHQKNTYIYRDSSKKKCNHFVSDKLSNINKTKDDINLEIYKKTKLTSSFRTLLYKIILDKNILYLLLFIDIILMFFKVIYDYERREEKKREEKRREEKRRREEKFITRGGCRKL